MINKTYPLQLLTPCFNGGARPREQAELRVPSIRGQIRRWYSMATPTGREDALFGGVAGQASRSTVTFRIGEQPHSQKTAPMLPHKNGGGGRPALDPQPFDLICRCKDSTFAEVDRAVRIWVLLGGLGARCNRAAGSVWFGEGAPGSVEDLRQTLCALNLPGTWDVRVAAVESFSRGRTIASDTVDGSPHLLGGIKPQRKDSPIKFKVLDLGGQPCLLMFAPQQTLWDQAIPVLEKPLGNGKAKPLTQLDWIPVL